MSLRLKIFRKIVERSWVEWVLGGWALLGAYDLLASQVIPDQIATKMPKVRDMLSATSGFLSWQVWAMIGMAILCIACVEYVAQGKLRDARYRQSALRIGARPSIDLTNFRIYTPPSAPDFSRWDQKDHFKLGDVAALWLNYQPEKLPLSHDVSEAFWVLHADVYAGKLRPTGLDEAVALALTKQAVGMDPNDDTEDPITVETLISRRELRRYAAERKERPPFLFKDARVKRPAVANS